MHHMRRRPRAAIATRVPATPPTIVLVLGPLAETAEGVAEGDRADVVGVNMMLGEAWVVLTGGALTGVEEATVNGVETEVECVVGVSEEDGKVDEDAETRAEEEDKVEEVAGVDEDDVAGEEEGVGVSVVFDGTDVSGSTGPTVLESAEEGAACVSGILSPRDPPNDDADGVARTAR
jgi:hypothetical protein